MNKDELKRVLDETPDKVEWKETTSLKFKQELVDFFGEDFKDKDVLEVGCHVGHTSRILSYLFKKVIALDNLYDRHEQSKKLNSHCDNIDYVVMDVYNQSWNFEPMDIVFIDCVHDYSHVRSYVDNSINTFGKGTIIAFDDYGLFPELKHAIDEYINNNQLKVLKKIGQLKGTYFPTTQFKVLRDYEGIICQVM